MPFRSEKQRRFLWAAHPDIAKRWAHTYPKPKKLPLYASDEKEKEPEKGKKEAMFTNHQKTTVNLNTVRFCAMLRKQAESTTVKINIPQSDKPVAAGEKPVTAKETVGKSHICEKMPEKAEKSLFNKLSAVLSQSIMQAIENEKAEQEARAAQLQPMNSGIKRYAMPAAATPPPMGMAQAPAQPAAPQQPAGHLPPVGGGSSPNANPINSYGALSSNGDINGNASFGTANSASKQAASPAWQRSAGKNPEGGLNEKGRKSYERETGGNLKAPVTESNPSGERAKRQNSFCSRMCGMKRVNTGSKTKSDPDSRINKSLRKWNCKCSSAYEFGAMMGQQPGIKQAAPMGSLLSKLKTVFSGRGAQAARSVVPAAAPVPAAAAAPAATSKLPTHRLSHAELKRMWDASAPGAVTPIDRSKLTTHKLDPAELKRLWDASAPGAVTPVDTSKLTTHRLSHAELKRLWDASAPGAR